MYFKRLEIVGFKSFYHKTTLDFEPGVTAIVGPNGCGKSNIFDSIRWVLGEQSVKALRGADMQDVIFNGTETKEALGMAEVSLTFDNSNRHFSIDHKEVNITRRIFRDGESEYLLNKNQVRLKDILDLLMGTGIGAESYSLIQQGKIDLVLSAKPEDRRLVFDEASGISKYKSQKRETLRRLEDTEQNLLRVNDIIAEVKRQIGSLERQASKARRYKEAFEELKIKETNLAVMQKKALLQQMADLSKLSAELQQRHATLQEEIHAKETSIASSQQELKGLEEAIMGIKNEILGLQNLESRNREHIAFNLERIKELEASKAELAGQCEQTRTRIKVDEEKLANVRREYEGIAKAVEEKGSLLSQKEKELEELNHSIKSSLQAISKTKQDILDLASAIAHANNEISDIGSQKQILAARQNRLTIEKTKISQERVTMEASLQAITQEVAACQENCSQAQEKINQTRAQAAQEKLSLNQIIAKIEELVMQKLTLESHKEFLSQLKTKYEDIGEAMNATIYLDKLPAEKLSGLVIKIKEYHEEPGQSGVQAKISGEAKPIDLDTQRIGERIAETEQQILALTAQKQEKEAQSQSLETSLARMQEELHSQEIQVSNKKTQQQNIEEQYRKIKEEDELLGIEFSDSQEQVVSLEAKLVTGQAKLAELTSRQAELEASILSSQEAISAFNQSKEQALVMIAQTRTELEGLQRKKSSDEATLKILEGSYQQDVDTLASLEKQGADAAAKQDSLAQENSALAQAATQALASIDQHTAALNESRGRYDSISQSISDVIRSIEEDRKASDSSTQELHGLQMKSKDVEYTYVSLKERILSGYRIDLETLSDLVEPLDENLLKDEIQKLKDKIDSYGSVNLVAIEEYDELKKRYDFLTQQQTDLVTAKETLHEAILKINRTTKKMFLETFEKVKEEFRNYFKLLFNGGDAQVYLLDENDPLESGIEIICRPPGKKLQNILLLSGGEKSMAAIALIFAIFKVKPAPFCILDEIDAALDEANVDRFGRILQEFIKTSQFIVITHNKKTIANADVMYGITMEESGVSKIVSVKFSQNSSSEALSSLKQEPPQEPQETQKPQQAQETAA